MKTKQFKIPPLYDDRGTTTDNSDSENSSYKTNVCHSIEKLGLNNETSITKAKCRPILRKRPLHFNSKVLAERQNLRNGGPRCELTLSSSPLSDRSLRHIQNRQVPRIVEYSDISDSCFDLVTLDKKSSFGTKEKIQHLPFRLQIPTELEQVLPIIETERPAPAAMTGVRKDTAKNTELFKYKDIGPYKATEYKPRSDLMKPTKYQEYKPKDYFTLGKGNKMGTKNRRPGSRPKSRPKSRSKNKPISVMSMEDNEPSKKQNQAPNKQTNRNGDMYKPRDYTNTNNPKYHEYQGHQAYGMPSGNKMGTRDPSPKKDNDDTERKQKEKEERERQQREAQEKREREKREMEDQRQREKEMKDKKAHDTKNKQASPSKSVLPIVGTERPAPAAQTGVRKDPKTNDLYKSKDVGPYKPTEYKLRSDQMKPTKYQEYKPKEMKPTKYDEYKPKDYFTLGKGNKMGTKNRRPGSRPKSRPKSRSKSKLQSDKNKPVSVMSIEDNEPSKRQNQAPNKQTNHNEDMYKPREYKNTNNPTYHEYQGHQAYGMPSGNKMGTRDSSPKKDNDDTERKQKEKEERERKQQEEKEKKEREKREKEEKRRREKEEKNKTVSAVPKNNNETNKNQHQSPNKQKNSKNDMYKPRDYTSTHNPTYHEYKGQSAYGMPSGNKMGMRDTMKPTKYDEYKPKDYFTLGKGNKMGTKNKRPGSRPKSRPKSHSKSKPQPDKHNQSPNKQTNHNEDMYKPREYTNTNNPTYHEYQGHQAYGMPSGNKMGTRDPSPKKDNDDTERKQKEKEERERKQQEEKEKKEREKREKEEKRQREKEEKNKPVSVIPKNDNKPSEKQHQSPNKQTNRKDDMYKSRDYTSTHNPTYHQYNAQPAYGMPSGKKMGMRDPSPKKDNSETDRKQKEKEERERKQQEEKERKEREKREKEEKRRREKEEKNKPVSTMPKNDNKPDEKQHQSPNKQTNRKDDMYKSRDYTSTHNPTYHQYNAQPAYGMPSGKKMGMRDPSPKKDNSETDRKQKEKEERERKQQEEKEKKEREKREKEEKRRREKEEKNKSVSAMPKNDNKPSEKRDQSPNKQTNRKDDMYKSRDYTSTHNPTYHQYNAQPAYGMPSGKKMGMRDPSPKKDNSETDRKQKEKEERERKQQEEKEKKEKEKREKEQRDKDARERKEREERGKETKKKQEQEINKGKTPLQRRDTAKDHAYDDWSEEKGKPPVRNDRLPTKEKNNPGPKPALYPVKEEIPNDSTNNKQTPPLSHKDKSPEPKKRNPSPRPDKRVQPNQKQLSQREPQPRSNLYTPPPKQHDPPATQKQRETTPVPQRRDTPSPKRDPSPEPNVRDPSPEPNRQKQIAHDSDSPRGRPTERRERGDLYKNRTRQPDENRRSRDRGEDYSPHRPQKRPVDISPPLVHKRCFKKPKYNKRGRIIPRTSDSESDGDDGPLSSRSPIGSPRSPRKKVDEEWWGKNVKSKRRPVLDNFDSADYPIQESPRRKEEPARWLPTHV